MGKSYRGSQVCTHSILGLSLTIISADLDVLSRVQVEYVTLPGWQVSIEQTTAFEELPENCRSYIKFIEDFLEVKVEWIGTGPGRYNMIHKDT